jgi:hypothetical protein
MRARRNGRTIGKTGALALATGLGALAWSGSTITGAPPPKDIALTPIGVYRTNAFDQGGAEVAAYDPGTRRVYAVNLRETQIDVLDISNPAHPVPLAPIDVSPYGSQANSVAVHGGVVAIAVEAALKTDPGKVLFVTPSGDFLSVVTVGALPDMLTFSPDGRFVLVANEGEPNSYNQPTSIDPEGSVSIIDMTNGATHVTQADVATAGFGGFSRASLHASVRIYGLNASVAQDLEPEYIAVSHDSKTAWVTLQENNAVGILDIRRKRFTNIVGLGFKDHSRAGSGLDASDRDSHTNNIVPRPVWGMYQPDGIAAFESKGRTYLVTANEGDVREWPGLPGGTEASRVSVLTLDPTTLPDPPGPEAPLKNNATLGRLNVTTFNGNIDADPAFERLFAFGARSFSIWNADVAQIFDSGDAIEQLIAAAYPAANGGPGWFNANHTNNTNDQTNPNDWTHDSRSDDKGPEPEGVTVAKLFGRQFAFIVLERVGGIVVYEVTDPAAPRFVDYVNTRVFGLAVPANLESAQDLGPEGVLVVNEHDSPTGAPLLIVANEVSGTTRIFEISNGATD